MENMMELVPQLTPQLTTVKLEDLVVDVSSSSSAAYVSSFAYPTLSTSSPSTIGMFASTHMRVTPRARFDHVKTAKTEPDSSGAVVLDLKPTVLGAGMRGDAGARDARDAPAPVELGVGAGVRLQGDDTANEGAQDAEAGPDVENGDADGSGDRPLFTAERCVSAHAQRRRAMPLAPCLLRHAPCAMPLAPCLLPRRHGQARCANKLVGTPMPPPPPTRQPCAGSGGAAVCLA